MGFKKDDNIEEQNEIVETDTLDEIEEIDTSFDDDATGDEQVVDVDESLDDDFCIELNENPNAEAEASSTEAPVVEECDTVEEPQDTDIIEEPEDEVAIASDDELIVDSADDFGDLSVIDISSDVEYQLNQERTGIDVVKLEPNKTKSKLNSFDLFFVRFWAGLVACITFISTGISNIFKKLFKKELPVRYVNSFIAPLLIILVIVIVLAPFNLTVGDKSTVDIFSNSLIPVAKTEGNVQRWGYVNKSNREVIPFVYYDAEPFYNNVAFVKVDPTTWRLIGTNGKFKGNIKIETDSANPDRQLFGDFNNKEKRTWILENGMYVFIKSNGSKAYGNVKYDYAESFSDGYALVRSGTEYYFINGGGKKKGDSYEEVKSFSEGRAAVKVHDKWTFIDTKMKKLQDKTYTAVTSFNNGYAWVRDGSAVTLIDKDCQPVLPADYVGMKPSDEVLLELGFDLYAD